MTNPDIKRFGDKTFDSEVLEAEEPVLVEFWAPWCGPCRAIAPVVDALASDLRGRVKVGKVDVDENPEVSKRYGILSIPTLIVFKGGKVVDTIMGSVTKARIRSMLDRHVDSSNPTSATG